MYFFMPSNNRSLFEHLHSLSFKLSHLHCYNLSFLQQWLVSSEWNLRCGTGVPLLSLSHAGSELKNRVRVLMHMCSNACDTH